MPQTIKSLHLKLPKTELDLAMFGLYLFIYGGKDQIQKKTANDFFFLVLYNNRYMQPNSRTLEVEVEIVVWLP